MDTRIIEVRKNILISRLLNGKSEFSANIDIDFIPDEVIIKNIGFILPDPGDPDNAITSIYSDLVSDYIGSFSDVSSGNFITPHLVFTLRKPVRGIYRFFILSASSNGNNNDLEPYLRTGDFILHLEFVKYRTSKPDKKIL